jgi:hypothetical protein
MAYPEFTTEELEAEEWRKIEGYGSQSTDKEIEYFISNLGRVINITIKHLKPGRVCGGTKNPRSRLNDYTRVSLHTNGRQKGVAIHRLVAKAFLGKPPKGKPFVNHKDTRKFNNKLANLEYVSQKENSEHAIENGLYIQGENNQQSKLTNKQAEEIIHRLAKGQSAYSLRKDFPVTQRILSLIRQGKTWKHIERPNSPHLRQLPYAGRPTGTDSPNAKISEQDVRFIREAYATGKYTLQSLADKFGMVKTNISRIVNRKSWKHVD